MIGVGVGRPGRRTVAVLGTHEDVSRDEDPARRQIQDRRPGRIAGHAHQSELAPAAPERHLVPIDDVRKDARQRLDLGPELARLRECSPPCGRGLPRSAATRPRASRSRSPSPSSSRICFSPELLQLVDEEAGPHRGHVGARLGARDDAKARERLGVFVVAGPVILVPVRVDEDAHGLVDVSLRISAITAAPSPRACSCRRRRRRPR